MITRRSLAAGLAGASISRPALARARTRYEGAFVDIVHDWRKESPQTPGVTVGVRFANGHIWNRGFGLADRATRRPMPADGYMRVGSVTKSFTGTVLLQLVDEGLIGLDDPLAKHVRGAIPHVPDADRITIRMLGNMASGLFDYVAIVEPGDDPAAPIWRAPFTASTPRHLVEIGLAQPPYFPPGEGWHYSNTNFVLLGMIIENLTGRSLGENIHRRIVKPLGLRHTLFPLDRTFPQPHPAGYSLTPPLYRSSVEITSIEAASGAWACGNMISTPRDLLAYAKPLATGRLISAAAQKERRRWLQGSTAPPAAFADQKYGFALFCLDGLVGHAGNIQGFETFMAYDPAVDASIVVISNLYLTNDPGLGSFGLARRLADVLRRGGAV